MPRNYRYTFNMGNELNDYPKFGIWPDGYYMSMNRFDGTTFQYTGPSAVVFDRARILQGQQGTSQRFNLNSSYDPMLPSDLDGATLPLSGAPNPFAAFHGTNRLRLWKFHVDWATPANSTFTGPTNLTTAAFDPDMCGYILRCIPQPGVPNKLDAISDRLMYRLAYRNFGDHESLIANHTVDTNGADHAGIRWYEIRDPNGAPTIFQQSTFSPDSDHRWMGSMAMDHDGNIALGYTVSSSSVYPSIRYTGRLATDPLGELQTEQTLVAGSGYHYGSRWGDYFMMAVDPVDDCTFWFTSEYVQTSGITPWRTRIGTFKFPSCGGPPPPTPTLTPTLRLTGTPTPTPSAAIIGHVVWQGRPPQPDPLQQSPITLTLKSATTEVNYPSQNTDVSGYFTVTVDGLPAGTYSYRAKGSKFLANAGVLKLNGKTGGNVEMGLEIAGDANNDNWVNITDFNLLKRAFGSGSGDPNYDDRADFTGDHRVDISDYNLLRNSFGQVGAPPL